MPSDESAGIFPAYPTLLGRPLSEREARLLERARTHAADFATRADEHDRDNSFPSENFEAMQESGYAQMTLPARHGGEDVTLLELCACQEQLAQGCAGTAIGVNMHCFTLGSMLDDLETAPSDRKVRLEYVLGTVGAQKSINQAHERGGGRDAGKRGPVVHEGGGDALDALPAGQLGELLDHVDRHLHLGGDEGDAVGRARRLR